MSFREEELKALLKGLQQQDRRALAKAITIVESDAPTDKILAAAILHAMPKRGCPTLRIAVSGPPGVGKSTFINILGQGFLKHSLRVGILPTDPASLATGGSLLADKTRMKELVNVPDVYIRPSSSRCILGGVSPALRDTISLVESAGYDVIIIETVGVGQSETQAYCLADFFIMLIQPGGGDALSAMKKGIMERADYLLVNKADGELKISAEQSFTMLSSMFSKDLNKVFLMSSLDGAGVDKFLEALFKAYEQRKTLGMLEQVRLKRFGEYFYRVFQEVMGKKLAQVSWLQQECEHIKLKVSEDKASLLLMLDKLGDEVHKALASYKVNGEKSLLRREGPK